MVKIGKMQNIITHIKNYLIVFLVTFSPFGAYSQINTEQVLTIGRNALYFEDYLLSIQYFNEVIKIKPYLADPYFYRAVAKFYLEDYRGAEADCSLAIERNPFIIDAYQVRGISRQTLKKDSLAIEDYDAGLKYLPENQIFLLNKAVAQQNIKDYDNAQKTFETLIGYYPKYDNGYLGLAFLSLEKGDTVSALNQIGKVLELNQNNTDAYIARADILIKTKSDFSSAFGDLDQAIKLEPKKADLFVNRAFLKYQLDDYFGAMSDFDYAISLDPYNIAAHLNRGLLRMEVEDNNKAIDDFSFVIDRNADNYMAIYNRAVLYQKTRQYSKAISDLNRMIEKYPEMAMLYYARSECKRLMGNVKAGEVDYNYSRKLMAKNKNNNGDPFKEEKQSEEDEIAKKFRSLVTVESENTVKPEYDNKYRGKVQNYNASVDYEDVYILTYYDKLTDLRVDSYYQKELDEVNASNYLRDKLYITNSTVAMTEEQIKLQFGLIRHYSSLLSSSNKKPIDYFGRAISYSLVKNYDSAIADLDRAIDLSPGFVLAYFARAMARYEKSLVSAAEQEGKKSAEVQMQMERHETELALKDLDKVVELSPNLVYAYYNKGNIYLKRNDFTSAISCFNKAIEVRPDFGVAYYNRGIAYFQLGNMEKGVRDLSKAGELGIMSSYNVLKRMSRRR